MSKGLRTLLAVAVLAAGVVTLAGEGRAFHNPGPPWLGTNPGGEGPMVFVTSQNLVYKTIVLDTHLPNEGDFQLLETGEGPTGLQTAYGLGDVEYLGGRWWVDVNGDTYMDDDDIYFMCPLVGQGELPD